MGKPFLWAFGICGPLFASAALAAGGTAASGIPGAVTYPTSQAGGGAKPSIVVPTPDTIPPPSVPTGAATPPSSIPTPVTNVSSPGRYRNARGEVKIESLIHDRYRQSVVRVVAKDLSGNVLARSMGVSIGRSSLYIAAPLSLVLGSTQQWADRIEITHFAGNRYEASVALIDEEKNLVLLAPEASPAPIVFTREVNERPQIDVFSISFEYAPDGSIASSVHRGRLAAANPETGLLSVSPYAGQVMDDAQAGTGLIDSEGNLVGMLLPGGRGVLSSTLLKSIAKASKATPIEPRMIGVILGRGVLVDAKTKGPGSYKTIPEALAALKSGDAPKTDPSRYTPARNRIVAPKETDKVVVKVMPGTYTIDKPISLGSDISLSGSGPGQTIIRSSNPEKPVILVQKAANVMIAGLRIVPAPQQSLKAPGLIVSDSSKITLLGNVFEAKGGVAAWVHESKKVSFFGNSFPKGQIRGLSCDNSELTVQTNAFVGDWPVAFQVERSCKAQVRRNLFIDNKSGLTVSASSGAVLVEKNSFVRSASGVRLAGAGPEFQMHDNLFFESRDGFFSGGDVNPKNLGRNAAWRSKFQARTRNLVALDIVRTEPAFEDPEKFDFRVKPGKGQVGASLREPGSDLGAFQRPDFLGEHSGALARSLGAVVGEDDLAGAWGLAE